MLGSETTDSVRNLGIVAWQDRSAALESMHGSNWSRIVRNERRRFNAAINIPAINERIPAYKASLSAAAQERPWFSINYNRLGAGIGKTKAISIIPSSTGIKYAYAGTQHYYEVEDVTVDLADEYRSLEHLPIYTIKDIGEGAQRYQLTAKARIGGTMWTKDDVGSTVAVCHGRAYYLKAKKGLWYYKCCSCDAYTGADERNEFTLTDHKYNLQLYRMHGGCPVLKADNNGYSMLFLLNQNAGRLQRVDEDTVWQIPCGFADRFVLTAAGEYEYRFHESRHLVDYRLIAEYGEPYFYDYMTHTLLTQLNGVAYIHRAVRAWERWIRLAAIGGGVVTPDTFAMASFARKLTLLVKTPDAGIYSLHVGQDGDPIRHGSIAPSINYLRFDRIRTRSRDGTRVTAGYVKGRGQTKGLLMVVYGAYGIPTTIGNIAEKWGPLLESGWAIGYAFVRGGGDAGWDWAEAGRRSSRERSLEDAEACLRALQRRLRVSAAHSIIYGRSAGGIQIGALANRHPNGDLFAGIYGEVPYLDVLQTTTNPSLPLTELEYDEFGDPRHRLADLMFWVNHSPITTMPSNGLPHIFILCRTGLNDTQVYAYEPVKWILAARGEDNGRQKLLGISGGQGHFFSHDTAIQARAEDCAILDNFISMTV
jgi:hypothetical protein